MIQPAHIMTWLLDWLREIVLNTHAFNANGKRKGRETHGIGSWKESGGFYAHDRLGASVFSRARWNSRAKSRAPAPSLSSFLFLPTGTFFLTWTLPSRLRWLIILALRETEVQATVLSVLCSLVNFNNIVSPSIIIFMRHNLTWYGFLSLYFI